MLNFLKLYRLDAFIIYSGSFAFGSLLGAGKIMPDAVIFALLVAAFPVNFVYSFNAIGDRDIDKINKPYRPLASGRISLKQAKVYVWLLFIISLPLGLLFDSVYSKLFYFLILLAGILYSNPVYPFKRNKYLAVITTSFLLIAPMQMALARYDAVFDVETIRLSLFIFFFLLITIPLKDIEDIEGDTRNKSQNWYGFLGIKLVYASAALNLILIPATLVWIPEGELRLMMVLFFLFQLLVTLFNLIKGDWMRWLYKQKILVTIAYMFIAWLWLTLK